MVNMSETRIISKRTDSVCQQIYILEYLFKTSCKKGSVFVSDRGVALPRTRIA